MRKEVKISNNLEEVNEMLHDWERMSMIAFCTRYSYDLDEVVEVVKGLIQDREILTKEAEKESMVGIDDWKEEYARVYNFL